MPPLVLPWAARARTGACSHAPHAICADEPGGDEEVRVAPALLSYI